MKIRTLLILLVPIAAAVYFLHYNREFIDLRLADAWHIRAPLAMVVLGAVLVGSLMASALAWGEASINWFLRRKTTRKQKRSSRAEERFARAQILGVRGKKWRARREIRRALRDDPRFIPALRLAADLAMDSGNSNDALQWNERLRTETSNSPDSIIRLSETLYHSGRGEEALDLLARNSVDKGASPMVLRKLRDMCLEDERFEVAAEVCERLAQLRLSDFDRKDDERVAGRVYLAAGEAKLNGLCPDESIPFLKKALSRLSGEKKAYLLLGDAHMAAGQEKRALRTWENGYQALGGLEFLQRLASGSLESEGEISRAAANVQAAGKRREKDICHHVLHAALMLEAGQLDRAEASVEKASALALSPEGEDSWVRLALHLIQVRCLQEKGERLSAENEFTKTAQEASRILLGRPISGAELKPH